MINIRSIIKLTEGDGFTLKAGKKIQYKTGYQVAFEGIEIYMLPSKAVIGNIWILPIGIHQDEISFEAHVNEYRYYNCSAETGKRVHFYIEGG